MIGSKWCQRRDRTAAADLFRISSNEPKCLGSAGAIDTKDVRAAPIRTVWDRLGWFPLQVVLVLFPHVIQLAFELSCANGRRPPRGICFLACLRAPGRTEIHRLNGLMQEAAYSTRYRGSNRRSNSSHLYITWPRMAASAFSGSCCAKISARVSLRSLLPTELSGEGREKLGSESEELGGEPCFRNNVPFCYPSDSALADHAHRFDAFESSPSTLKRAYPFANQARFLTVR